MGHCERLRGTIDMATMDSKVWAVLHGLLICLYISHFTLKFLSKHPLINKAISALSAPFHQFLNLEDLDEFDASCSESYANAVPQWMPRSVRALALLQIVVWVALGASMYESTPDIDSAEVACALLAVLAWVNHL